MKKISDIYTIFAVMNQLKRYLVWLWYTVANRLFVCPLCDKRTLAVLCLRATLQQRLVGGEAWAPILQTG